VLTPPLTLGVSTSKDANASFSAAMSERHERREVFRSGGRGACRRASRIFSSIGEDVSAGEARHRAKPSARIYARELCIWVCELQGVDACRTDNSGSSATFDQRADERGS
jgi:hypothetical protein